MRELTTAEAAKLVGCSPSTIGRHIDLGNLSGRKVLHRRGHGFYYLADESDVILFRDWYLRTKRSKRTEGARFKNNTPTAQDTIPTAQDIPPKLQNHCRDAGTPIAFDKDDKSFVGTTEQAEAEGFEWVLAGVVKFVPQKRRTLKVVVESLDPTGNVVVSRDA